MWSLVSTVPFKLERGHGVHQLLCLAFVKRDVHVGL
jgi:hypothetical protein